MYASNYGEGSFHWSEISYAQFPAASTKGAQLFPLDSVTILEGPAQVWVNSIDRGRLIQITTEAFRFFMQLKCVQGDICPLIILEY